MQLKSHYLALDLDGEVIIDTNCLYPDLQQFSYRYWSQLRHVNLHDDRQVESLFTLMLSVTTDEQPLIGSYALRPSA